VLPLLVPRHPAAKLLVVLAVGDHERRVEGLDDNLDLAGGFGQAGFDEGLERNDRRRDRAARHQEARHVISAFVRPHGERDGQPKPRSTSVPSRRAVLVQLQ